MPITKEILDMLEIGHKPSQVILVCLFRLKIAKIAKIAKDISVPTLRWI